MLSNTEFICQSLELNLFFLRIAKEHSIFLEAAFVPSDFRLAQQADKLKSELTELLSQAIALSDGVISKDVISSGELVTDVTLESERITELYMGIFIDTNITNAELLLRPGSCRYTVPLLVEEVYALNQRAIMATTSLAEFKAKILSGMLMCRAFTHNYPLLIDHILREARFYINMLVKLQNRVKVDMVKEMVEQEIFWNRIMAEHAKFIRGLLDPTEEDLFDTANDFGKQFDELTAEALKLQEEIGLLPKVTEESLVATIDVRDFKKQGTEGLIDCSIRSIAYPLLGDHVVREANHYIRLLKTYRDKLEADKES